MNYHNCGLGSGRVQGVELMVWVKDKLDDMDVSLKKEAGVQNGDHNGLFIAKPIGIHHFLGSLMKALDIVFPFIPQNLI